MNKSFENKMSPALSMFNHIYKEFNEIYHEATLKMGFQTAPLTFCILLLTWEMVVPRVIFANIHAFQSRLLILPLKKWQVLTT